MPTHNNPIAADREYLAKREEQSRLAAARSADPAARRAHETLAKGYAARLRAEMPAAN
ncbi:MAG: hypothetical protein J0J06_11620 [Sphingomonas sp.]|uniref:hypothetical protein n=1 Tax=Sphingomonas sp. TaxID=28214 RepID=UPI001ACB5850|nr:hypothetical protein [Sphingomonas sp.]MBN8816081.1 hypothetical protein [Sphingomonas sp.]